MEMIKPLTFLALTVFLAETTFAETVTDPEKAGPEYAIQGEYAIEDGEPTQSAQVIALGDGNFELVLFAANLPGAEKNGWKRGMDVQRIQGAKDGNVVKFKADNTHAVINGEKLVVEAGKSRNELKKTVRKSSTLGAKPPEGAVVLFNGNSADAFQDGKITEDGFLEANTATKQKFGDHTLHVEFRTPFKPEARGQARGNSGVYIQSRYELQVLDSFGLEGKNNECGGIYSIAEPIVNACFPPLTWQTYDIDFTAAKYDENGKKTTNARATVRHNGILIHDDIELPHGTPGRHQEGPGPDEIYLQGHGNPVVYKNIWVMTDVE
jgi:hypothetical protein